MDNPISSGGSSGSGPLSGILGSIRLNDVLNAMQNGVQAINNLSNSVTTKISSVITANPGGSSGQVQFNTGTGFGGLTVGGDATLVSTTGVLTIASHAVTYGKIQAESATTLLGNPTGASASPSEVTVGSGLSFSGSTLIATVTSGMTFLGTVTTASSQIIDTSTTTNLLAANSTIYRSFRLVCKNIVIQSAVGIELQVHSGGTFQSGQYTATVFEAISVATTRSTAQGTGVFLTPGGGISTSVPGYSGEVVVSNLNGTTNNKTWFGTGGGPVTGSGAMSYNSFIGYWGGGTGAIDGFQLVNSTGITGATSAAFASGSVDVYGML